MMALLEGRSPFRHVLARAGGVEDLAEDHLAQILYLAVLHDLGKVNHGFQDKRYQRPPVNWPKQGHVKVVLESLRAPEVGQALMEMAAPLHRALRAKPEVDPAELLLTAVCHHGRPWRPDAASTPRGVRDMWLPHPEHGRAPLEELERLRRLAELVSGIASAREGLPWTPLFSHEFAGALTLADWIGSSTRWFPFAPGSDADPDAYWRTALDQARRAVREVGLVDPPTVAAAQGEELLRRVFPETFPKYDPTPLQRAVLELPLPRPGSRVVIESETGSGKTEAALTLYARLRQAGLVAGLVFALPTRATAHAMFERVSRAVERLYPEERPVVATAVGGIGGSVEGEGAVPAWDATQIHEDDRERRERLVPWATEHHKRFFAAEIVVGTVDQVLLAGLPVRHAHLRLGLLSRHMVVIDEVHSYDRYMSAVLRNLMDPLSAVGSTVVLLSATVSEGAKSTFTHGATDPRPLDEAVAVPYPLVSVSEPDEPGWHEVDVGGDSGPGKELTWSMSSEVEALAGAEEAAQSGASVLVLVNTVHDARRIAQQLVDSGAEELLWRPPDATGPVIYHSRYAAPDRKHLDRAILASFGRPHPRHQSGAAGCILIATQVAEQSLDIDFDFLLSFAAPVDVLLQRVGRLHRHPEKPRPPSFSKPQACIIAPHEAVSPNVERAAPAPWMGGRRHGWGEESVYQDLADLELTRRVIREHPTIRIPRDNRLLIESVYHEDVRAAMEEEEEWSEILSRGLGRAFAQLTHAVDAILPFEETYLSATCCRRFGREERVRTRLGDDSIVFQLREHTRCWYAAGQVVETVEVPLRVLRRRPDPFQRGRSRSGSAEDLPFDEPLPRVDAPGGPTYRLPNGRRITYTPWGWDW